MLVVWWSGKKEYLQRDWGSILCSWFTMWIKPSPFSSLGLGVTIYKIRTLKWVISSFSFCSVLFLTHSKSNVRICLLCKECRVSFVSECIWHSRIKPAWKIFADLSSSPETSWLTYDQQGRGWKLKLTLNRWVDVNPQCFSTLANCFIPLPS